MYLTQEQRDRIEELRASDGRTLAEVWNRIERVAGLELQTPAEESSNS